MPRVTTVGGFDHPNAEVNPALAGKLQRRVLRHEDAGATGVLSSMKCPSRARLVLPGHALCPWASHGATQTSKKRVQGSIARLWGLLHPVARARNRGGPEIRAAGARIGVEIQPWDKVAHRVPLPDEAARLLQSALLRRKLLRI